RQRSAAARSRRSRKFSTPSGARARGCSQIRGGAASALNQTEVTGRRSSLAIIASADLVQTNGLGLALCSARKALMAACRSAIEWKTPRRIRCRVILEKKFSTALSQEAEVGVKWKVQRG